MEVNTSCRLSGDCTGLGALQTQEQHNVSDLHSSKRRMPCEWPEETNASRPSQQQDLGVATSPSTPSSIFSRFGSAIKRVVTSPARNLQYLFPQNQVIAHDIVREDGARKRRYIHAGIAGAPGRVLSPARDLHETAEASAAITSSSVLSATAQQATSAPTTDSHNSPQSAPPCDEASSWATFPSLSTLSTFPARSASSSSTSAASSWKTPSSLSTLSTLRARSAPGASSRSGATLSSSALSFNDAASLGSIPSYNTSLSSLEPGLPRREAGASNTLSPRAAITKKNSIPDLRGAATSRPARKGLIKNQLRVAEAHPASPSPNSALNHNIPSTPTTSLDYDLTCTIRLKETIAKAKDLQKRIDARALVTRQDREKDRENDRKFAEASAQRRAERGEHSFHPSQTGCDHTHIINAYFSPSPSAEVPKEAPDAQSPTTRPRRKRVTWTKEAEARPFYSDQRVGEMHDSHFEHIQFNPTSGQSTNHGSDSSDADSSLRKHDLWLDPSVYGDDAELEPSRELSDDLHEQFQAKLALEPPKVIRTRLVAPPTQEETEKLLDAAAKTNHGLQRERVVIEPDLKAHDFGTLLPNMFNGDPKAWLNDSIVNEYLTILTKQKKEEAGFKNKHDGPAPPVHAFSSFWYTTANITRWATRAKLGGAKLFDVELLLFPICDGGHWRLLALKPKERSIEYLDSLGFDGSKYVRRIKAFLKEELKDLFIEEEWVVVGPQRSSRQMNGSDCGVFTALNAVCLLRGEDFDKVLSTDGMYTARERMALTLLARAPTAEYDTKFFGIRIPYF